VHQKDIAWFRRRAPSREVRGKAPLPEAETLFVFGCSVEAENLLAFLSQIACTAHVVLQKLT